MDPINELTPEQLIQASHSLTRSLRTLYRSARHLQHTDPYAAARLGRIADQAEYFLQQWPDSQWPKYASSPDWPMPEKQVLLTWLDTARREATTTDALTYTRWHQMLNTLLAALVLFT
ncbi:hypothetical protein [Hymenobacter sp. BT190]|uniref:hypothetical protein n=1 Tax=Hymenobacter sp. BT190 TaxID=2763505 RepID=UPI0016516FF3|nr:hypothetical protein [Hymenobacter sp. BT190]MBC6699450.1 hypothetical protein [Hymenobacter sp. BT190]